MQWKSKWKEGLLVAAMAVGGLTLPGRVSAQNTGYTSSFATSITYQNVGTAAAQIVLNVYEENGNAIQIDNVPDLPKGAGASIFVGNLQDIDAGFKGAAVMEANQPIVATMVQIPSGTVVKNRPLINGFTEGASNTLIATVLKNKFNATTQFSVQNVGAAATNFTLKFYNADTPSAAAITVTKNAVPAGAARYFDLGTLPEISAAVFNGSVTIEASSGGQIVAAALELSTNGIGVSGFEGVTGGANTLYMPSALCNAFGGQGTAYAIQNTSTTGAEATVTVQYAGGSAAIPPKTVKIAGGGKASFVGCGDGLPAGFNGSATITSTGAQIVGIGKVNGGGLSSAFVGATSGSESLALPYVRYTQTRFDTNTGNRQRTNVAIQNVGPTLAAGSVTVYYLDKDGNVVGRHVIDREIPRGGKVNSNPLSIGAPGNEFGYSGSQFGGSAIVQGPAGSQLVAVARVQSCLQGANATCSSASGEDFNGIAVARQTFPQ